MLKWRQGSQSDCFTGHGKKGSKVDKRKLSRTLKLNLELLIQLGKDSVERLQVTYSGERDFISEKLPCLARFKRRHGHTEEGLVAAEPCGERTGRANRKRWRGCGTPRVSTTTGPEVRSLLMQSLKNTLAPNSHLDLVGPLQE